MRIICMYVCAHYVRVSMCALCACVYVRIMSVCACAHHVRIMCMCACCACTHDVHVRMLCECVYVRIMCMCVCALGIRVCAGSHILHILYSLTQTGQVAPRSGGLLARKPCSGATIIQENKSKKQQHEDSLVIHNACRTNTGWQTQGFISDACSTTERRRCAKKNAAIWWLTQRMRYQYSCGEASATICYRQVQRSQYKGLTFSRGYSSLI
jgi:hypothetical protein